MLRFGEKPRLPYERWAFAQAQCGSAAFRRHGDIEDGGMMPRTLHNTVAADKIFWMATEHHDQVTSLSTATGQYGEISAGRYTRLGVKQAAPTCHANPCVDMLSATVALRARQSIPSEKNGRGFLSPAVEAGMLHVYDLRHSWLFDLGSAAFDSFVIFIPWTELDRASAELKQPRITSLDRAPTGPRPDPVMHGIAQSLLPLLDRPAEANRIFLDYIFSAILFHLVDSCNGLERSGERANTLRRRNMLTLSQQRNVTARMRDDLKDAPGVNELAAMCGLSRSHFIRAFRETMGLPPHRWLLVQRVERAKILLRSTDVQLAEMALDCGFADQSHFSRVFTKFVGSSPQVWRRHMAA